ncbi:MAG: alpha/beta hydrolase [Crocinitomicaceae bacterium]|nr:alpha/beta hydrolase [Crocinitomicaceae bacterium]
MKNLIILHGALGAETQFEDIKKRVHSDFIIWTMNFYGHGGNAVDKPFRIREFANELEGFIKENVITEPLIFGYSMGGMVALDLASRKPELIDRIVTLGTKFGWSPEIAAKEIQMLNPEVIQNKVPKFAEALAKRHAPEDWKKVLQATEEMMLDLGAHPPVDKNSWSTIKTPVTICLGDQDEMVSKEETQTVYDILPNAEFVDLHDSKHAIEQANLDQLVEVLVCGCDGEEG